MASQASSLLPDPTCLYLSQRESSQDTILMVVLPDREAETLATWLRKHPGVLMVSRDRGGNSAEGVNDKIPCRNF